MIKIDGLDKLNQQLNEAQEALNSLDGELGTVTFDPEDPASIELAIQNVNILVDGKLVQYASNPIIGPMAEEMKERYRDAIIERAAAERLKGGKDE